MNSADRMVTRGKSLARTIFSRLGLSFAATLATCAMAWCQNSSRVPDRVLVKFNEGTPALHAMAEIMAVGGQAEREIPGIGVHVVSLPPRSNLDAVVAAFSRRPNVEFAEPDMLYPLNEVVTPNDPNYSNQWHLPNISAPQAWAMTMGSPSVIIAILDTGCDPLQPDLAGLYVPGRNTYNNNNNTDDVYGHGTAVAGSAAAMSNNGIGVASVAWNCRIMPIRVSDTSGSGSTSAMAEGLTWASDNGARVANISYKVTTSSSVSTAAKYFMERGGVVTVSAGNYGSMHTNSDNPYILTVNASDLDNLLASWSDYGKDIDLIAPGTMIKTTTRGGTYGSGTGTSFSAPIVAGVAALVISANPSLTGAQVQQVLKDSADDLGSAGWDNSFGWGKVNAARAVFLASSGGVPSDTSAPEVMVTSPNAGSSVSGSIVLEANATDNVGVQSVSFSIDGAQVGTDTSAPFSMSWNTSSVSPGTHNVTATAIDAAGNSASHTVSFSVIDQTDTQPPVVAILNPQAGVALSNSLSVAASASDNVGVVRVEIYVDGALKGTDSSAPYSWNLNTKKWPKGSHTLQCRAYDGAGNSSWSTVVSLLK